MLVVGLMGCQSFSFSRLGGTDVPEESMENLVPDKTVEAAPPSEPMAQIRQPGELASEHGEVQPKDRYAPSPPTTNIHTVTKGDTLFILARKYYGDQRQWRRIYQANRNRIDDPQRIKVGMKLIIP